MRNSRWLSPVETKRGESGKGEKKRLPVVSTGLNHRGPVLVFAASQKAGGPAFRYKVETPGRQQNSKLQTPKTLLHHQLYRSKTFRLQQEVALLTAEEVLHADFRIVLLNRDILLSDFSAGSGVKRQ